MSVTIYMILKTKARELKGLVKAGDELRCNDLVVIAWEYEGE